MRPEVSSRPCRLLIFEGIMGAGKSTATRRFRETLAARGLQVAACTEAADPHPVRASDDLPDFFQPWLHIGADELARRVREKWARYVEGRLRDGVFTVMDGQLFHGDLSNLFMMEMAPRDIAAHTRALTDSLFGELDCAKLAVETGGADWPACYRRIEEALEQEWARSTQK